MASSFSQAQSDTPFPIPVDSLYITEACIPNISVLVSQVACQCLRTSCSSYARLSPQDDPMKLCCPLCKKSSLLKLTNALFTQHLKTSKLPPLSALQPTREFLQSLYDGSYEVDMRKTLAQMLNVLRSSFRIRMAEIVQTVALFDRILKQHWACFPFFYLFRSSLKTMFLATVLVAHKSNTDLNIRNAAFASSFHLPMSTLNHFELSVLELLDYNTIVSPQSYASFGPVLFSQEDWNAHKLAIIQDCASSYASFTSSASASVTSSSSSMCCAAESGIVPPLPPSDLTDGETVDDPELLHATSSSSCATGPSFDTHTSCAAAAAAPVAAIPVGYDQASLLAASSSSSFASTESQPASSTAIYGAPAVAMPIAAPVPMYQQPLTATSIPSTWSYGSSAPVVYPGYH